MCPCCNSTFLLQTLTLDHKPCHTSYQTQQLGNPFFQCFYSSLVFYPDSLFAGAMSTFPEHLLAVPMVVCYGRRYKTGIPLCLASSRGIVTGLRTPPAMLGASFLNCLMPPRARPSQAGQHERFHSAQVNAAHFTRLTPAQRYSFIFFQSTGIRQGKGHGQNREDRNIHSRE